MAMALLHNFAHNSGSNGDGRSGYAQGSDRGTRGEGGAVEEAHRNSSNGGRSGGCVCDGNVKVHDSLSCGKDEMFPEPRAGAERNGHTELDSCR